MKGLKDLLNKYVEIKRIGKHGKFVVLNTNITTLEKEVDKLLTLHDVGCSNLPDRLDMTSQKDEMSLEKVKNPKLKDVFSWKVGFTDCYEWIEKMQ